MIRKPANGLFVAGVDTEVGKTYVAALIARELAAAGKRVGVYKPVASGCSPRDGELVADDAVELWRAAGENGDLAAVCPQRFAAAVAPPAAAAAVGLQVDAELLRTGVEYWTDRCDVIVVEGAGGLMSPMAEDDFVADVAFDLGYPLIVVAPNRLGVINQTLQTLITASVFRDGLDVAGVVLNNIDPTRDDSCRTNRGDLTRYCSPPVLGEVNYGGGVAQPIAWRELM